MASAYVKGPTLAEEVSGHGPLGEGRLRSLGAVLAEALKAIHACGLVHRDLKPSNIVLAEDGPRVLDFGIAQAAQDTGLTRLPGTGMTIGTYGFMAPEQATGAPIGPPCDVFALGAVLVAAAGGNAFGQGQPVQLLYRVAHEPPDMTGVPASLRPVVLLCLDKDPERRPNPQRLLHEFVAYGPGSTVRSQAAASAPPSFGLPVADGPPVGVDRLHEERTATADAVAAEPATPATAASSPDGADIADLAPVPIAMYRRTRAGRVTLVLWNLLATALLVLATAIDVQWLHTVAITVICGPAGALTFLRTLGTMGDRNGFDLDHDGITMAYTGRQFTVPWSDIEALEVGVEDGQTWITVRQHAHAAPFLIRLPPRWIKRGPANGIRFRTDWTRPVSGTGDPATTLRVHASRRSIAVQARRETV